MQHVAHLDANNANFVHIHFPHVNNKWNTNQEVANILYAAHSHPEWIAMHSLHRPPSGTHVLLTRYDGTWFKNDGFVWRRRNKGKLIREDHMKLKVLKQELISANYVHSAIVPTFHRRVYWLTHNSDFVLIHYLNTSTAERGIQKTAQTIAEHIQANQLTVSHQMLVEQLGPIYAHCLKPEDISVLATATLEALHQLQNENGQISEEKSNPIRYQLERRNSCSSAFRRGLSSMALRRQPSANSEIDANFIGSSVMKTIGCGGERYVCPCVPSTSVVHQNMATESRSPSGDTELRSSNQDEDLSVCHQLSIRSSTGGASSSSAPQDIVYSPAVVVDSSRPTTSAANKSTSTVNSSLAPIVDVSPSTLPTKGGKILVIGGWYMKGHEYKLRIGEQMVSAKLIQAGVLSAILPPVQSARTLSLTVYCNGQAVSSSTEISFIHDEDDATTSQVLLDRLQLTVAAFDANDILSNMPTCSLTEDWFVQVLLRLDTFVAANPSALRFPSLLSTPNLPSRTLLHLSAALDFGRLIDIIISLGHRIIYCREFDVVARDSEGATPLHVAVCRGSENAARSLVQFCHSTVDVLDDRGRTPCDLSTDGKMRKLMKKPSERVDSQEERLPRNLEDNGSGHVNATELWVMTNGETVTREHLLHRDRMAHNMQSSKSSSSSMISELMDSSNVAYNEPLADDNSDELRRQLHVEISMDTNVHVPDSPKMARLFDVVTSPGVVVTDGVRAKMASLARQIIDALPERIKQNDGYSLLDDAASTANFALVSNPTLSQHVHNEEFYGIMIDSNLPLMSGESTNDGSASSSRLYPSRDDGVYVASTSRVNNAETDSVDFDKDLGEFFSVHVDATIDPIQQRLGYLKLTDNEQREVYEAAMVIQRAYREYRARNTSRRQADIERRAAVTIQSCYRRYKQFCYFKKLHDAAIVVQKHFRMRKRDEKEEDSASMALNDVPEHPTLDGQSIRIQVPQNNSSLLREHRAAKTIQLAYRGHRKRQAAARKIQKFMKQSRNKLRKMHVQNEDAACTPIHHQNKMVALGTSATVPRESVMASTIIGAN